MWRMAVEVVQTQRVRADMQIRSYGYRNQWRERLGSCNGGTFSTALNTYLLRKKNILQYSHIKIIRARNCPKLLYTNSLHTIPWWFKLVGVYKYLTTDIVKRDYFYKPNLLLRHIIRELRPNTP